MAKGDQGKGTKPKTAGGKAGLTAENISTLVELPDISKSKEPAAARSASHGSDRDTLAL